MVEFDLNRLSELVGGLDHFYPLCPNYSDDLTAKIIGRYLSLLSHEIDGKSEATVRTVSTHRGRVTRVD
jgi:hypothetical protein